MPHDQITLDLYNKRADEYAEWSRPAGPSRFLSRMIERLPKGGTVLDFGCGAGWDSVEFRKAGLAVTAIDGSIGLVRAANRLHGIGAICMTFDKFNLQAQFDGVWASFTLQHVPRANLPGVIASLSRSLRSHGLLFVGMHHGDITRRDSLGRLYCHQDADEFSDMLDNSGFSVLNVSKSSGTGYDGTESEHMHLEAVKTCDRR